MNKSIRTAFAGVIAVVALLAGSVPSLAATAITGTVTAMSAGAMSVKTSGGGAAVQKVDTSQAAVDSAVRVGSTVKATGDMMANNTLKATQVAMAACAGC